MKFSSKRIIAIVLAAVLVFSMSVIVGTFSAAEDKSSVAASVSAPESKEAALVAADQGEMLPVTVVGNVKNVVKTSFEPHQITLTWDRVNGASGYYVYCLNADGGKYTRVADVTATKVTVKNLKHTTQYWFKISAYLKVNGKKIEGQTTQKKTATQPAAVTGLYASRSSTVNEMKWNRNDRATGYKIYRACYKTDGYFKLYKTINNNKTTVFADNGTEQGRAYYYKVVAFRKLYGGEYNSAGNIVRFVAGMCAPNFTAVSRLSKVNLLWNHNKYAQGYDIYYSTDRYSGFKLLGSTKSNYYTTKNLTN
jgi:fibronectin type 3 domain-containing protein